MRARPARRPSWCRPIALGLAAPGLAALGLAALLGACATASPVGDDDDTPRPDADPSAPDADPAAPDADPAAPDARPPDARPPDAAPPDAMPATYPVGGTVAGLSGSDTITLLNNGGGALVAGNGAFQFAMTQAAGTPYAVTVGAAGANLCTVANGSGTVTGPVSNVTVACTSGVLLQENFDAVTVPNLPAGWSRTGSQQFVTVTTASDTAPQAAFVPNPSSASDNTLVSPTIALPSTGAVALSFRHRYNLESRYDGAVLEISVAGGAFTDIVDAGGVVTAGGYNDTVSTLASSPLTGRAAWTNDSGAFVTTSVTLPSSAAGTAIVLRWRMATDNSVSDAGWWIDTVLVRVQ